MQETIALAHVARTARCHDVLPRVRTTLAARDDVVDALSRSGAVLASVAVPGEHATPVQGRPATVRHLDEVAELDHRRHGQREVLGPQGLTGVVDEIGLVPEHWEPYLQPATLSA